MVCLKCRPGFTDRGYSQPLNSRENNYWVMKPESLKVSIIKYISSYLGACYYIIIILVYIYIVYITNVYLLSSPSSHISLSFRSYIQNRCKRASEIWMAFIRVCLCSFQWIESPKEALRPTHYQHSTTISLFFSL